MQAVTSGANPVAIKKGIDKTCTFLVKKLKENARPVKGTDDIRVPPQARATGCLCQQKCLTLLAPQDGQQRQGASPENMARPGTLTALCTADDQSEGAMHRGCFQHGGWHDDLTGAQPQLACRMWPPSAPATRSWWDS